MRGMHRAVIGLFCILCCTHSAAVFADDGLTITLLNNSSDNVLVTVYDQNTRPPRKILAATAIYGSASLTVSISVDAQGQGHLSWTAVSMDPDMRKCGKGDNAKLTTSVTVSVHADGDCDGYR
jgi:hypothetical protein